ncbi:MAG: helix-turn-helix transcriptional regulator [Bacteroidota bacterium]
MNQSLQDYLFERILNTFPKRSAAVEALGKLMGLGKDAVYRRLRGHTLLSLDELAALAREFKVSLDDYLFSRADSVVFSYSSFSQTISSYRDYLDSVSRNIERIYLLPEKHFYYATSEIPLFHYCHFPEVIGFKLYVWARTIWSVPKIKEQAFHFDLLSQEDQRITSELLNMYNDIPSTELWHLNIVDNTLNQIEYHVNIGGFQRPEDALVLCDRLLELCEHIRKMAAFGHKYRMGGEPQATATRTFDLFHNEMVFTNNNFLAVTPVGKVIFTTYCNPNFLKCTDERMCNFTEDWFKNITSKSIAISNHAEKNRSWYFNTLHRKIERVRTRISNQVEEGF